MKTKILIAWGISCMFILTACQKSAPTPTPTPSSSSDKQFTISGIGTFNTPQAYLQFSDRISPIYDGFSLIFIDSDLRNDTINGTSINTNATTVVGLHYYFSNSQVSSPQDVDVRIGMFQDLDNDSGAFTSISGWTDTYVIAGITYGEPDVFDEHAIDISIAHHLTINDITIDYANDKGTINCDYEFTTDNGDVVMGRYIGDFKIHYDK